MHANNHNYLKLHLFLEYMIRLCHNKVFYSGKSKRINLPHFFVSDIIEYLDKNPISYESIDTFYVCDMISILNE
jgi:hypothetical protein